MISVTLNTELVSELPCFLLHIQPPSLVEYFTSENQTQTGPSVFCLCFCTRRRHGEEIHLWHDAVEFPFSLGKSGLRNVVYDHTLASFSYLNEQRFNYQMMTVSYGATMAQGV